MTNQEIGEIIRENNERIEELMNPNQFVLNNTVAELLEENRALQEQCTHEFEDGFCIYCLKSEGSNDD